MPLSRRDAIGLALAASTVALLVAHGGRRHAAELPTGVVDVGSQVPPPAPSGSPGIPADVLAFVDVNLLSGTRGDTRSHQVVVVRDGVVIRVGAVGSVELPSDARVIQGRGTHYLYAVGPAASPSTGDTPGVVPGASDELLLLPADPRVDPSIRRRPRGRLLHGIWHPSPGIVRSTSDETAGGH